MTGKRFKALSKILMTMAVALPGLSISATAFPLPNYDVSDQVVSPIVIVGHRGGGNGYMFIPRRGGQGFGNGGHWNGNPSLGYGNARRWNGIPHQQYNGIPRQHYNGIPRQQYNGIPRQQYSGIPRQHYNGIPRRGNNGHWNGRPGHGGNGGHWNGRPGHGHGHHGHGHHGHGHHGHNHNYYGGGFFYPYYGWSNYCGGYGSLPYDCFYGDGYYDNGYYDDYYDYGQQPGVSSKKHVKWCRARYKTYNASTDTFVGKGGRKYRCNSPYDGRQ
jgi:hypothetical protein